LIRRHGALASAVHCAFDLLELDGRDLRREPIENRKALLKLLRGSHLSIVLNEHFTAPREKRSRHSRKLANLTPTAFSVRKRKLPDVRAAKLRVGRDFLR
jgi:hypothetical protein